MAALILARLADHPWSAVAIILGTTGVILSLINARRHR